MPLILQALLAAMPILLAAVLLVGFRMPAKHVMPIVYLLTATIGVVMWQMSITTVLASSIQG